MKTPPDTTMIITVSVCPRCGTIGKSGKMSCCGRGGAWFKHCGGAVNTKRQHTWYEGIQACKTRTQSKTAIAQKLNGAQQKDKGSSDDTDMANSQVVIATTNTFAFTSANTSPRSMLDTKSIVTATYTLNNLLTTTPAHILMRNTPRFHVNQVSSANNPSAIASLTIRECVDLLPIILLSMSTF